VTFLLLLDLFAALEEEMLPVSEKRCLPLAWAGLDMNMGLVLYGFFCIFFLANLGCFLARSDWPL